MRNHCVSWLYLCSRVWCCGLGSAGIAVANSAADHETAGSRDGFPYVKLDARGHALAAQTDDYQRHPWSCVLDRRSGLVWEVKTRDGGLRDARRVYSWFKPGNAEAPEAGHVRTHLCDAPPCNTQAYIEAVNAAGLCGSKGWRLPEREELRTLLNYAHTASQGLLERQFFPNDVNGFYWSATADRHDVDAAWGIGTTFGFDYSYFTADPGHVRLVTTTPTSDLAPSFGATDRYQPVAGGGILDRATRMVWARCHLGQTWTGSVCAGQPRKLTWQQVQPLLESWDRDTAAWQLPDLNILSSLWRADQSNPAIDTLAFPATFAEPYWTATAFAGDPTRHWVVNFFYGENDALADASAAWVRPVRPADESDLNAPVSP